MRSEQRPLAALGGVTAGARPDAAIDRSRLLSWVARWQLKQISGSIVDKITPILDPQQQQKFQAIREGARRRLLEKMSSQLVEKAEADVKQKLEGFE